MKIQEGEVFAIKTKKGYGFLQYIKPDQFGIPILRVLEPIKECNELSQKEVDMPERFTTHFIANIALRRKIIEKAGIFNIPEHYQVPTKVRDKHIVRGEFLGWHIIDEITLRRELKSKLSQEDLKLSPHGISNDTLLIEYLETNWRLEDWK